MIEIEIHVRHRDKSGKIIGKSGHETLPFKELDKLKLSARKSVAADIAEFARKLIAEEYK